MFTLVMIRVQELCESRDGRPGLSVLMSLMVSVDVKQTLNHPNNYVNSISEDIKLYIIIIISDEDLRVAER